MDYCFLFFRFCVCNLFLVRKAISPLPLKGIVTQVKTSFADDVSACIIFFVAVNDFEMLCNEISLRYNVFLSFAHFVNIILQISAH